MSLFTDASLVMIPSGIKDQKVYSVTPTDGSGDLTFSRASNATRVNSSGLVEKVRENLLTYSQDFSNAAWIKSGGATLTHSQTDPNGGTTATRVQMTSGVNNYFFQGITGSGTQYITLSIWIKGVTTGGTLSLNTGTASSRTGTTVTYTTSWVRYDITQNETTTNTGFQIDNYSDSVGQVAGDFLIAFAQVEASDFGATDYIATTSAAVSVGPVSGLPRLDYLNSSCPRLLLEPQRTNKWFFTEQFDNAEWVKTEVSITANAAVSPDGYTNADKIVDTTANDEHRIRASSALFGVTTATTFSIFAKAAEYSKFAIADLSNGYYVKFDLSAGTVISTGTGFSNATITNYGNGWYRLAATNSTSATYGYGLLNDAGDFVFTGTGTKGVFIYGAQAEEAAYATSYIPTLSTAVTRVADVTSKSGISSLIGQANGTAQMTFVMDYDTSADSTTMLGIHAGTSTSNRIQLASRYGTLRLLVVANGSIITNDFLYDAAPNEVVNVAFKYGSAGVTAYVNGTQVYTTASAVVFTQTMELFTIGNRSGIDDYGKGQRVSQSLLFTSALSNSDLATLTA